MTSPQLALDVEPDESRTHVFAFIAPEEFDRLPSSDRLAIRQAIQLFDFMASKPDPLLAPVFQPLLGRIDDASETLILQRLGPLVPGSPEDRDAYFSATDREFLAERVRSLKRLLVTRSPIMPTGLLLFCLEYARGTKPADEGILGGVRSGFADFAGNELEQLLKVQYDFRNEYIAHEKREPLRDVDAARAGLEVWTGVLAKLRNLVSSDVDDTGSA